MGTGAVNNYSAYVYFNITAALRLAVTQVTLRKARQSLNGTARYTIITFRSKDAGNPQPVPIANDITFTSASLNPGPDTAASGTVTHDITSIFSVNNAIANVIGVALLWANPKASSAIDSDWWLDITGNPLLSLAPTHLMPTATQNPHGAITLTWWHTPNPALGAPDPQVASEVTVWQGSGTKTIYTINNANNTYTLPAYFFNTYDQAHFTVRTQTQYNGWGAMSAQANFNLGATPPLAPVLKYPLNISVNAEAGALLEWSYNSPYDTTPSGFDIRYRTDGGAWVNKHVGSVTNTMTNPITGQHTVEWQVLAYGALNDAGPWSVTGTFYTIGIPAPPTIVSVNNSNRPLVSFSAINILSWQIQFLLNNTVVYDSENNAFDGMFSHLVNGLISNGNYIVRMRITNQYGLTSNWAERPATINTSAPAALTLTASSSNDFFIRLHFNNSGQSVYVYRSEGDKPFMRIAKTVKTVYDDYTAAPGCGYVYFVRVVNNLYAFADSNYVSMRIYFPHTTLADARNPGDLVKLQYQLNDMPKKSRTHQYEKSLTQFVGRALPVLQVGELISRSASFSYYVSREIYDRLVRLNETDGLLILRNSTFGTMYGTIDGPLQDEPALVGKVDGYHYDETRTLEDGVTRDGYVISFTFTEAYYEQEVVL